MRVEERPPSVSHPSEHGARRAFAIACVMVLATLVRVWGLQSQSLTMDEIADVSSASQSLSSVIHVRDGFPPLYGLLVHGSLAAFPGEANVRWLSVILGVLTVLAMWRFGSWAGGERVGLLAALALAISPFHRWISQEARAYVLYVLLATVALWLFFRAMSTNERRDWALYALTSAAGVYSHYFFALLPLVAGVLLLFERRTWAECARGVWANVALAAACVPAIGLLRADMAYQASYLLDAPFSIVTLGYAYFSMIAGFAIGPSLRELHSLPSIDCRAHHAPMGTRGRRCDARTGLYSRHGVRTRAEPSRASLCLPSHRSRSAERLRPSWALASAYDTSPGSRFR